VNEEQAMGRMMNPPAERDGRNDGDYDVGKYQPVAASE